MTEKQKLPSHNDVRQALGEIAPEYNDEWKTGFLVARKIRTLLARHGWAFSEMPSDISAFYPDILEVFDDDVALSAAEMWPKVEMTEDENRMTAALRTATDEVDAGRAVSLPFPLPSKEQDRIAKVIAGAARILTGKYGGCFLPTHLLGERLGCSHELIAQILRILRSREVLERTAQAIQRRWAAEYRYIGPTL